VFTFTIDNVKQFGSNTMLKSAEKLSRSTVNIKMKLQSANSTKLITTKLVTVYQA